MTESVLRIEVEKLAAAPAEVRGHHASDRGVALVLLFVDCIAAKHIIAPALNTIVGGAAKLYEGSRAQIQGAIDAC
jgi:hypothetical protein